MSKLLYVCASQFSGTTLLSFLLNQHSEIATVGHTMGWSFKDPDKFRCSCGERIADCPLFRHVAEAYARAGLEFRPENFGTAFRVSTNPALNYYLTEDPDATFDSIDNDLQSYWLIGLNITLD